MGGHQSTKMIKDEWLTPPDILATLGEFYLDPCSPVDRPWDTAKIHYNISDNGLSKGWFGRVWLNPPYGRKASDWLKKMVSHGNGIALIFARTETEMFFEHVWEKADALLFFRGRLYFHHVNGERAENNAGAPSVLIAYGLENVKYLEQIKHLGQFIRLSKLGQYETVST
ncbi:adenine methyltransferase [Brevibacillus laterosporus]|uniref:Adenine methyltransferase n=2 Tax=Brevibacillus laterosporus TaxID=1465 RepID=A0AAP8QIV7_BRELA|nr:adenine methyltransferase [Brevibacillus laterosporus]